MSESTRCPKCGIQLSADAPAGLCPKCLVQAGFESQPLPSAEPGPTLSSPASTGFAPPKIEELAPLFPQLEILELLGKGGMGAVYKARQPGLDRLVAVKILPPEISRDAAFAERFQREARALARLSHPHIVAVYDFGQTVASSSLIAPRSEALVRGANHDNGLCYIVMEFVDGANLRQTIKAGKLTPAEALAIVPQICEALQFAHDEGIVHRDIKPENILIDKRGRVKIADFGLAKLLGQDASDHSLTATHQVMGTLRYMAPEQMQGSREVDHRADIYSLGVVFYELLTGELPMGKFAPPSKKVQIDVRLDEIVLRALEQEPELRYQHASEVKTDVETISRSPSVVRPESARGVTPPTDPTWETWWFEHSAASRKMMKVAMYVVGIFGVIALVSFHSNSVDDWKRVRIGLGDPWYVSETGKPVHFDPLSWSVVFGVIGVTILVTLRRVVRAEKRRLATGAPASVASAARLETTEGAATATHLVQAPADCLLLAAGIALVTACGVALWLMASPTRSLITSLVRHNLTAASVTLATYSLFIGVAGLMLRRLRARLFVLLVAVIAGLFLPAAVALNVVMEFRQTHEWLAAVPLWLGMPAALWVVVRLFRDDVRRAFDAARADAQLSGEPGGVSPRTGGEQVRGLTPSRSPSPEQISLWAAISGVVLPALLLFGGTMLSSRVSIRDGFLVVCFLPGVGLELVAFGCGLVARGTKSGKAGLIISSISLVLCPIPLTTHLNSIPTRVSTRHEQPESITEKGTGSAADVTQPKTGEQWFGNPGAEHVMHLGPESPTVSDRLASHLGLDAAQREAMDQALQKFFREFRALEGQATRHETDANGHQITTIAPLLPAVTPLEQRFWAELDSALDGRQLTLGRKTVSLQSGMFETGDYGYRIEIWRVGQINPWFHWTESYPGRPNVSQDVPSSGPELPEKLRRFWKEPETDDPRIQGTWNFVSMLVDGQATDLEDLKSWKMIYGAGVFTGQLGDYFEKGSYKLDPTKTPKTIDVVVTEGPNKGHVIAGIYEWDGDNLKFCWAPWGNLEHPKEFSSTPGSGRDIAVLKREKPASAMDDATNLQGTWVAVAGERNGGQPLSAEEIAGVKLNFDRDRMRVTMRGRTDEGTIKLDVTQRPKRIAATRPEGPNRFGIMDGIYELDGDHLRVCMGEPEDRPTEFKTKAGSRLLTVDLVRQTAVGPIAFEAVTGQLVQTGTLVIDRLGKFDVTYRRPFAGTPTFIFPREQFTGPGRFAVQQSTPTGFTIDVSDAAFTPTQPVRLGWLASGVNSNGE